MVKAGGVLVQRFFGWSAVAFAVAMIACLVAFEIIGSYVDEAGVLHEPFGLIPLAWCCAFLAGIAAAAYLVLRVVGASNKRIERTPRG